MGNRAIYYGAIVLGIIILIVGLLYEFTIVLGPNHPTRGWGAIVVGVVLLLVGIIGMFMARSRS